jgi:hypothetical protein
LVQTGSLLLIGKFLIYALLFVQFIFLTSSFNLFRKHFPFEDYDEYLFGVGGLWNGTARAPDVLVLNLGLHTCFHSVAGLPTQNTTLVAQHKKDLKTLMRAIRTAVDRNKASGSSTDTGTEVPSPTLLPTTVVIQLAGRVGNSDPVPDRCSRTFNRLAAYEAHLQGFLVLEREEIERRLLFKSEYYEEVKFTKNNLHLENPAPNIIGTSLLTMISCLQRNGSDFNKKFAAYDV